MVDRIKKLIKSLKQSLIHDVPDDMYSCLNCNKNSCNHFDWENCKLRLQGKSLKELNRKKL